MSSMNDAPSSERVHIGFFGRRNAGKSSLVNAFCGQDLSVVSDTLGTTTDPVLKSMELLPLGPVVIIDTPGFDDEGSLGRLRVQKARRALDQCDVAVLVVDACKGLGATECELIDLFKEHDVPWLIACNKRDLFDDGTASAFVERLASDDPALDEDHVLLVSARTGEGVTELKERVARLGRKGEAVADRPLVRDLLHPGERVVVVIPIDKAAPKGRLILPEQMTLRDILDADAVSTVVSVGQLAPTFERMAAGPDGLPSLVITDSQAFSEVARAVPAEVPLTSFSILMARKKGLLEGAVRGVTAIDGLHDGDRVLVSEGCTHHRQCGDIGTVKLPRWLKERTGAGLVLDATSGREFPDDVTPYRLVLHCGGCMLNAAEMQHRAAVCRSQGVPMTNYGTAIAYMKGILRRSLSLFPELVAVLDEAEAARA